jgi:anaerobic ribonucleoside-triphosphate reductase activating protein
MDNSLPVVSAKMTFMDWPSPDDAAVIVYIAGCKHNCKNCQSPDLQNPSDFPYSDIDHVVDILIKYCKKYRTNKVVLSGGDPLYHNKQVQMVIDQMKKNGDYHFCIYTGFEFEEAKNLINGYDFIKTGVFDDNQYQESEKTDEHMVLASKNQKFYNSKGKLLTKNGILKF